ncbi:MAG: DoxX family protein [Minwuia sp.]|nr:DoxX family protein [Minwuia sp.]
MMNALSPLADLVGRILLSTMFILSGLHGLSDMEGTARTIEAEGMPGELSILVIITKLVCGPLLLIGFMTRLMAFLLGGFSVLTALLVHAEFGDPTQVIMFLKNLAIAGGMGIVFANGAGPLSIDGLRRR